MSTEREAQLVVIGAGPGGYPAAFHAADLGLKVILIDRDENPGGVCLYRGCIPSKALLHAAQIIQQAREAETIGIRFGEPDVDFDRIRAWRDQVVTKLTSGLGQLTQQLVESLLQVVDRIALKQGQGFDETPISETGALVGSQSAGIGAGGWRWQVASAVRP